MQPQILATPEAFRSNYMFMDNLSLSIEEKDVYVLFTLKVLPLYCA